MTGIYLGLGSNVGNRENNLHSCYEMLDRTGVIAVKKLSSVYETEPYGFSRQNSFYNMVVEVKTQLNPFDLLDITKDIEIKLGRKKTFRWGPRIIDIDILSYHDILIDHPDLTIPHQQLHIRRFVLIPLKEIANRYIHPKFNKTVDQMITECKIDNKVRVIE